MNWRAIESRTAFKLGFALIVVLGYGLWKWVAG